MVTPLVTAPGDTNLSDATEWRGWDNAYDARGSQASN